MMLGEARESSAKQFFVGQVIKNDATTIAASDPERSRIRSVFIFLLLKFLAVPGGQVSLGTLPRSTMRGEEVQLMHEAILRSNAMLARSETKAAR